MVKKPSLKTEKMSPDNKIIIKTSGVAEVAYNCFEPVEGKFLAGKNLKIGLKWSFVNKPWGSGCNLQTITLAYTFIRSLFPVKIF